MRKIDIGDGPRDYDLNDLIAEFQFDVEQLNSDDIDDTEYQLITNQYAYVKFGLILEKIRTRSWWVKCSEKFNDFRSFCQTKVNLNIWQVANAIKSARVAVRLAFLGFTDLPRNASQALKMSELSIERLGEVWGNVVSNCQGHKITALAIEQEINPDKIAKSDNLRIPAALGDKIRREAIERGIGVTEYLERMMNGEFASDNTIEPVEMSIENEVADIANNLDLPVRSQPKSLDRMGDMFDELLTGLVGRFIPPVRRIANE